MTHPLTNAAGLPPAAFTSLLGGIDPYRVQPITRCLLAFLPSGFPFPCHAARADNIAKPGLHDCIVLYLDFSLIQSLHLLHNRADFFRCNASLFILP